MKYAFTIVTLCLIASCAQQTQPTGGPKDEQPPVLIESDPENGSINFKGSQIELSFSESIQVEKAMEQIIISPAVKETETSYRKNKVILTFKTPLKDSTTYSINFREAVKDLTEKNPASNLKLAFSTGTYLDSLSISGNVFDLISSKPLGDVTVALHYESDTFNIFKHKAEIFTKADKDGRFLIENLKSTTFYIYAFQDKNKNLVVDGRNEKYGFQAAKYVLTENVEDVKLPLVALDPRALKLISGRPSQNYFLLKTNKGINTYELKFSTGRPAVVSRGEDNSSIKLYQTFPVQDSVAARLILTDSLENRIDTTVYIKYNAPKEDMRLDKFAAKTEKASVLKRSGELTTSVAFTKPLKHIMYDSIYFVADSLNKYTLKPSNAQLDTQRHLLKIRMLIPIPKEENESNDASVKPTIRLDKTKQSKTINEMRFAKGAFISIDSDSSTYQPQKASFYKDEDLAITLVETNTKAVNYFIELLSSQGTIIQTSNKQANVIFKDLLPGEYSLRLVIDNNSNGKWDAGNYFKREEPEPIFYYADDKGNQKFNLKANWEYGPLLIKAEYPVNNLGTIVKK